jgi:hypothetical protein
MTKSSCTETTKKKAKPPKWSEQMTMHLNGGSTYSELHYQVFHHGKKTKITHHVRTNGSPKYLITADEFHAGEATFDRMATKGKGLTAWLRANV